LSEQAASTCTNCDSTKQGEFCSVCGQNSRNYLRAAYRIVGELLSEVFEFDSRLFRSLRYLVLSPGFLSNEFSAGRRAHYISPARLYLVVSLIFFFLLSVTSRDIEINTGDAITVENLEALQAGDSERRRKILERLAAQGVDTSKLQEGLAELEEASAEVGVLGDDAGRKLEEKVKALIADPADAWADYLDNLPLAMFLLLPFFALLLKAAYPRRFYSEHFVFALHLHAFLYLVLIIVVFIPDPETAAVGELVEASGWETLEHVLMFACLGYGLVALKKVYKQSVARTVAKGFVLLLGYGILLSIGLSLTGVATFLLY